MIDGNFKNKIEEIIKRGHTYNNMKIIDVLYKKETLDMAHEKDELTLAMYNDDIMREVIDPAKVNFYSNSANLLDGILIKIKNISII